MKTKIKNTILSFTVIAAFSLVSCENLLDIEQHGTSSFETFYQTDEEADEAITACYTGFAAVYFNYYLSKNNLCDDFWCGGGGRGDNDSFEKMNEWTFNQDLDYLKNMFTGYYQMIYSANVVLGHVPDETPVQKRARAEARVFRAFAYIDLISMWGTPPLVDHELTPSEYRLSNGEPDALWKLVEDDLNEAIADGALREKSNVNDRSSYRVTKQLAQALLGKALVFQKKWAQAAQELDKVITSDKYDLYADYENMLQYTAKNNCESLFEINHLDDPANAMSANWSLLTAMTGWRSDKMDITSGLVSKDTWGFCSNFQKDLYDAFVANGDNYRLKATMKTYDEVKAQGDKVAEGKELYGHEGYFMWKNRIAPDEMISGGWLATKNNHRVMRYAEVLLLAAEAHLEAGNNGKALEYINRIRSRAKLNALATIDINQIRLEKRLELCGESVRFQDMLRWGIAEEKMRDQGKRTPSFQSNGTTQWNTYNSDVAGFKSKHNLLPFPQIELTLNPNIKQNTGW
jgi:hypothetical protein